VEEDLNMPHLRIETNVPSSKISSTLLTDLTRLVAKILGKPESYCVVTLVPDQRMAFGGSEEPCAIANLMSIGRLGQKENIAHSKALFEKITAELGILPTRMYITFQDEPSSNVGYNGTTFYEIFGG